MTKEVKISAGKIKVEQTAPGVVVITLTSSEQHPGVVQVQVVNDSNNDTAKLIWIK